MSAIELTTSQWVVKARVFLRHKMDKVTEDEPSDTVLYRNLYTNILSQQINAENRLFHLMTAREGQNDTFDKHLAEVRARVEKDRKRIQKLGELLVFIEKKEMQIILKGWSTCRILSACFSL